MPKRPRPSDGGPEEGGESPSPAPAKRAARARDPRSIGNGNGSCEECKVKHDRCDGEQPVCGRCRKKGLECHYPVEKRLPGPRRGWVDGLKSRVESLHAVLREVSTAAAPHGVPVPVPELDGRSESKPREFIEQVLADVEGALRCLRDGLASAPAVKAADWSSPHGSPSSNATLFTDAALGALPHAADGFSLGGWRSPSPTLEDLIHASLAQLDAAPDRDAEGAARVAQASDGDAWPLGAAQFLAAPPVEVTEPQQSLAPIPRPLGLFDDLEILPPANVVNELLVSYFAHAWEFRHVKVGFPVFHKKTFLSTLATKSPLLVYSVLAFSSSYVDVDNFSRKQLGELFFSRCRRLVATLRDDVDGLDLVQAMLAMAQYASLSSLGAGLTEALVAACVAKLREMGAFVGGWAAAAGDWRAEEERRRTVWGVFMTDRILAVLHGNAPLILDSEMTVTLPCDDEQWGESTSEGAMSLCRTKDRPSPPSTATLYFVMGKTQIRKQEASELSSPPFEELSSPRVEDLEGVLDGWKTSFLLAYPELGAPALGYPSGADFHALRGLLLYHTTAINLYTPRQWQRCPASWVTTQAYRRALEHAAQVEGIIHSVSPRLAFFSPLSLMALYYVGFVWVPAIKSFGLSAAHSLDVIANHLDRYGLVWSFAHELAISLRKQRDTALLEHDGNSRTLLADDIFFVNTVHV